MKLLSVLPLVGAAAALPQGKSTPPSLGAFGVMATHSGSPIHLSAMTANATSFWLGGKTNAYCPPNVPEIGGVCPPGNETQIIGGSALVSPFHPPPSPNLKMNGPLTATRTSRSPAASSCTSRPAAS